MMRGPADRARLAKESEVSNPVVLFVLGGILLVGGAELLVRGASRLAIAAGITPLVVGLTVVAFGTSAPEMAVTVGSAYAGQAEVALGNVIGSNIFNVLFILGVSALIAPLVVAQQLIRFDVPLLIGASVVVLLMALDGGIGRIDWAVLFAGIVAYTVFVVRQSRREVAAVVDEYDAAFAVPAERIRPVVNVVLVLVGLSLLVVGARWLVDAAVTTATALGVSELVIGLTIVAAGTSLPENRVGSSLRNLRPCCCHTEEGTPPSRERRTRRSLYGHDSRLDVHRAQVTIDWVDHDTGESRGGRVTPATREQFGDWLQTLPSREGPFAVKATTSRRRPRPVAVSGRGAGAGRVRAQSG